MMMLMMMIKELIHAKDVQKARIYEKEDKKRKTKEKEKTMVMMIMVMMICL